MRRHFVLISAASLALAAILGVACKKSVVNEAGDDDDAGGNGNPTTTNNPPASGDDDDGGTNAAGETDSITGLPCDVEAVLQNNCTVCHTSGSPYDAGPPPLVTYSDLLLMATADPTQTRAALGVQYMIAHTMPKPPAQPVDPDEIATMSSWIDAGYPQNPTACVGVLSDGGGVDASGELDAGSDAGEDAGYDGGCLNGAWPDGNKGSELMHPGEACIACHTANAGPKYRFAGTVFPHVLEPNDCNGDPNPVTVTITGANKKSIDLKTNAVGNFFSDDATLTAPFTVKITQGNNNREMQGSVAAGDCNGCHTVEGANKAPGRILTPTAP